MVPILHALPIDWTGHSPNNRTKGELHDLSPQYDLPYRIVVMESGYFYTNDIYIIDNRGKVLQEDLDYQCLLMSQDVADKTGLAACAIMVITNPNVGNYVYVEAQMVGGQFCNLNTALLEQAANVIRGTNRRVLWKNLKDKPNTYRPNGHLHALWELFGFSEQVAVIHRMTTACDKISQNEFDNLYREWTVQFGRVEADLESVEDRLTTHINDHNNPHLINVLQVQLQFVTNAAPATLNQAQAASGTILNAYSTPLRAAQSVGANFTPILKGHREDTQNPHRDTAAKLGTMTTVEWQALANKYYTRGEVVASSVGLGGRTWSQYYTYVRSGIPAVNLTTGIMPWNMFSKSAPPKDHMLVPTSDGFMAWRPVAQILDIYEKKGNMVIYAGTQSNYSTPNTLAGVVGTNWPNGTICAVRYGRYWSIGTGNGGINTYLTTLGMAVINNGVWQAPGFA